MESYNKLAEQALIEQGEPMDFKEITEYVTKHKDIKGKNPQSTVIAVMMRNKKKFNRVSRGVYGLVGWDENTEKEEENKPNGKTQEEGQ